MKNKNEPAINQILCRESKNLVLESAGGKRGIEKLNLDEETILFLKERQKGPSLLPLGGEKYGE